MKKLKFILIVILVLLSFISCTNNKGNEYTKEINKENDVENTFAGTLVISAIIWSDSMDYLVERFSNEHPNVNIIVEAPTTETISTSELSTLREKMVTTLLSGDGADIYEIQLISGYKYSKSGMFENLYSFMEKDPTFNFEDYYTNIFKCCEFNGELNWAPQVFSYEIFRMNKNITNLLENKINLSDRMDYLDIFNIYQAAVSSNIIDSNTIIDNAFVTLSAFDPLEYRIYIDTDKLVSDFDSPGFIKYLDKIRLMPFSESENKNLISSNDTLKFEGKEQLIKIYRSNFLNWNSIFTETDTATKPIELISSDKKNTFTVNGQGLAISKSSKNKELAWEFIKYVICEKEYDFENKYSENYYKNYPYYVFMPINKRNYEKLANFYSNGNKEQVEFINIINENLNAKSFIDPNITDITQEIQDDYYFRNLISPEECAKQIQNRVELFLNE